MRPIRIWGNKKVRFALIGVAVGVVVGFGLLVFPRNKEPVLSLNILNHTNQQGKQFVFFRLDVKGNRRVRIDSLTRPIQETKSPHQGIDLLPRKDFWDGKSPEGYPFKGSVIFGVPPPTNSIVWKLALYVEFERLPPLKVIWWRWKNLRTKGKSLFAATSETWNTFYTGNSEIVMSDPITNTPPNGTSSQ